MPENKLNKLRLEIAFCLETIFSYLSLNTVYLVLRVLIVNKEITIIILSPRYKNFNLSVNYDKIKYPFLTISK